MTKHAIISTKIPLPEDEFDRAEHLLKVRAVKTAVQAVVAEHFSEATPEVSHHIAGDEPAPTAPKVRKPRRVYETAAAAPAAETDSEAPTAEAVPVRHGRHKAA